MEAETIELTLGQPAIDGADEEPDDQRFWSVTTLIGCLEKPGLIYWSATETATEAVDNADLLTARIEKEGREAVIDWLSGARFRSKDRLSNADLGSCAHEACESYALTGSRPDADDLGAIVNTKAKGRKKLTADGVASEVVVLEQMLDRFDEWLARFQPSYQATEVTVYNPTYGYAGTCDGFLSIDGVPYIIDYKTSRDGYDKRGNAKSPYPEAALQLAAYRHATHAAVWRPRRIEKFRRRYYLLSDVERDRAVPVPEVDGGLIIHITPDHCEAFPTRCDDEVFTSFLYVTEASRWVNGLAKDAIGQPIVPGAKGAA